LSRKAKRAVERRQSLIMIGADPGQVNEALFGAE